jgi:hypothetical protein
MNKKDIFLSEGNIAKIRARAQTDDNLIFHMKTWLKSNNLDDSESLIYDELSEVEHANRKFIAEMGFPPVNLMQFRELEFSDYGNIDPERSVNVNVSNEIHYRSNKLPIYQTNRPKFLDPDSGERQHTSHDYQYRGHNMQLALKRISSQKRH